MDKSNSLSSHFNKNYERLIDLKSYDVMLLGFTALELNITLTFFRDPVRASMVLQCILTLSVA